MALLSCLVKAVEAQQSDEKSLVLHRNVCGFHLQKMRDGLVSTGQGVYF